MDISWFHLQSVSESLPLILAQKEQTILTLSDTLTNLLSVSVLSQSALSSFIFIAYLILSTLTKRSSYVAAFFMSCMLMELSFFDPLSEASLYLLTFSIYSYVICCKSLTLKSRLACGILLILSITLAYDAYFYGIDGRYGETETIIYNNIESLALCAHSLFIGSFIPFTRIWNNLRSFIDSISHITRNSAYIVIC